MTSRRDRRTKRLIGRRTWQAGTLFSTSLKEIDQEVPATFSSGSSVEGKHTSGCPTRITSREAGVDVVRPTAGEKTPAPGPTFGGGAVAVAISLLFAAMEVAGVPLAVLDEVDASLDEV